MSGHPFPYSSAPIRRVDAVQFGILSPEEIVCFIGKLLWSMFLSSTTFNRKRCRLQRSNIQSYTKKAHKSQNLGVYSILSWAPLIATISAKPAVKAWQNVQVTLPTLILQSQCSILVCIWKMLLTLAAPYFTIEHQRFLEQSQEDFGMCLCTLL